ncbi:hypothetical protein [Halostagnicola larsenii]|uniref:hypothetical protein n=1 Tax=Halostagnicola larsenii TaxID=353800 RepID=UPI0012FAD86D|nr:hypothetical protein [Halostagnicola larsenii]
MNDRIARRLEKKRAAHLGPELIGLAKNRPSSDSKYLSKASTEYILSGESGSYEEGNLENRISNRVSDIPIRIQRLINDLAILSVGGYLDDTSRQWDRILDIKGYAAELSAQKTVSTADHPAARFGYDLGFGVKKLICGEKDDQRGIEFLWGIILSQSATPTGDKEEEMENINCILNNLRMKLENTVENSCSHPVPDIDPDAVSDFEMESKVYAEDEIIENLEDHGIEPTPFLLRMYSNLVRHHTYENNINVEKAAENVVGEQVGPHLVKSAKVRSKLVDEWDTIDEASVPGVDVKDVLKIVWENRKRSLRSADIASELGGEWKYKKQVTNSLNKLSVEGKNPSESLQTTYEHDELIQWNNSSWELTSWGDLLCFFVFERSMDTEWIQQSVSQIDLQGDFPDRDLSDPYVILERGIKKSPIE